MSSLQEVLSEDIKRQTEIAKTALEQAKTLELAVKNNRIDAATLNQAREALVKIALELSANTTTISTDAIEAIRNFAEQKR